MPCMFAHVLTNNPKKHHCDWHGSGGAAESKMMLSTGWVGLGWAGSFVLMMLFTSSLSWARVCSQYLYFISSF